MESAITPVLEMLDDRMKHLNINDGTGGGGVGIGIPELAALEDKWEGQLNEVADWIDLDGCVRRRECVDFAENHIPVGHFQWFIDLVSYLQFLTVETVLTA